MKMKKFQDKVVLVTGGGSGIGRATALAFAKEGANVVIADVVAEGGQETLRMIKDMGGKAIFVRTDVTKESEVKALVERAVGTFSRLDCAFNNAGINGIDGEAVSFTTVSQDSWDRVIDTNLKGVWLCMKYEIEEMLKRGGGVIVNTASIAGLVGMGGHPAYTASKHGVVGLTKDGALQYAKAGVRVNAVCPATIRTPMVERMLKAHPEVEPMVTNMQPIGRVGRPEEVAQAVLWLCSDDSSFVTGHALAVDGGFVAQ
jgi:NAD(P)-dependent dehydrogenase (short-subunit alcohol dehydrogenase family)